MERYEVKVRMSEVMDGNGEGGIDTYSAEISDLRWSRWPRTVGLVDGPETKVLYFRNEIITGTPEDRELAGVVYQSADRAVFLTVYND